MARFISFSFSGTTDLLFGKKILSKSDVPRVVDGMQIEKSKRKRPKTGILHVRHKSVIADGGDLFELQSHRQPIIVASRVEY